MTCEIEPTDCASDELWPRLGRLDYALRPESHYRGSCFDAPVAETRRGRDCRDRRLGAGIVAIGPNATAGEAEGRAALQKGDYTTAIAELKPLAEQGEAGAQYLLAETYFGGHGGTMMEALKWMTAAADQGYAQAQARLGLIYATGRGVATNNVEAYRWFSLAAKLADPKQQKNLKTVSQTNRTVVAKSLTPQQRATVDAEVAA